MKDKRNRKGGREEVFRVCFSLAAKQDAQGFFIFTFTTVEFHHSVAVVVVVVIVESSSRYITPSVRKEEDER